MFFMNFNLSIRSWTFIGVNAFIIRSNYLKIELIKFPFLI